MPAQFDRIADRQGTIPVSLVSQQSPSRTGRRMRRCCDPVRSRLRCSFAGAAAAALLQRIMERMRDETRSVINTIARITRMQVAVS